jgi:hypothetical protein
MTKEIKKKEEHKKRGKQDKNFSGAYNLLRKKVGFEQCPTDK